MKRIFIIAVAIVMAFSFIACKGETEGETEEELEVPSAQEIVDRLIELTDSVRTYQFDMDMTMKMSGESEGKPVEVRTDMDYTGALDMENQEIMMDMTMNMATPDEEEIRMAMAIYIIGDMMYMMTDIPMMYMDTSWMKSEVPEGMWEEISGQMNQIESMVEILDAAQVEVTGTEKVGGIDCYVVEVTPDLKQLWEMVVKNAAAAGEIGAFLGEAEDHLDEILRWFSVKYWIAKDTYFLAKMEMDMTMHLTPEAMGYPEEEGEVAMNITMAMLAYDYNKPVSIILPPEAEDAVEMSMP